MLNILGLLLGIIAALFMVMVIILFVFFISWGCSVFYALVTNKKNWAIRILDNNH